MVSHPWVDTRSRSLRRTRAEYALHSRHPDIIGTALSANARFCPQPNIGDKKEGKGVYLEDEVVDFQVDEISPSGEGWEDVAFRKGEVPANRMQEKGVGSSKTVR